MVSPNKERARIEVVCKALSLITNGEVCSRRALFSDPRAGTNARGPQWQFLLLKALIDEGLIERIDQSANAVYYRLGPNGAKERLEELRSDKEALSRFLWPSQQVAAPSNEDEDEDEDEDDDENEEFEEVEELPSDSEMLAAILKMNAAALENIVHLRQQVEEMKEQLRELHDAWVE